MQEWVFPFIKTLHADKDSAYAKYMSDAIFKIPTPLMLDKVVTAMDGIYEDVEQLHSTDARGDIYEYLLSKIATAGVNGQFRTPRHIIRMIVDMMEPQATDVICDPACGTSGFLVAAGEYLKENRREEIFFNRENKDHYMNHMFYGFDMDRTMLRIGAMNMMTHGIDNPYIEYRDSLSDQNTDREKYSLILANPPFKGSLDADIVSAMMTHGIDNPYIEYRDSLSDQNTDREKYSLILANPPFKGSLDADIVSADLLKMCKTKKTELLFIALFLRMLRVGGRCACIVPDGVLFGSSTAHKAIRKELVEGKKTELLFIALFLRMLRVGGRCACIVPDGVLFGSSTAHKAIRKELVEGNRLEAVISMPSGVFKPYAGVSTAVVPDGVLFGSSTAHKAIRKELVEGNRLEAVISMPSGVFKPYAGVSTAVLVFTKTGHGGTDKVWFYDMKADGFSLDDKRSVVEANDIPDIIERFHHSVQAVCGSLDCGACVHQDRARRYG